MSSTTSSSGDGQSLTARAASLMAAKTLAFGLGFALPLLLVRQLSVGEFGLYRQMFLIVNTAIAVLPMGFATSAYYFWAREPARRDAVVLNILLFHLLTTGGAGLVLALRPELLAAIFHGPELSAYGAAIGLVVLLWGTSSFLETVAIASGDTRAAAGLIVALQLSKVVLLLGAALFRPTLQALATAAAVQGMLQLGVAAVYVGSRFGRFWRAFDAGLMRAQISYALPHGLAAWLYWIHMEAHHYVVAHRFDAATYAVYAVGCFQLPLLAIVLESAGSVAIPRVSQLQKEGRSREILALAAELTRKLAAVCLPLFAFLFVVRREFMAVLFTEEYLPSVPIFAVNLALVPLAVALNAGDAVIRAYAECRFFLLKLRLALTTLTLPGVWLATGRFGPVGAVVVVVAVTFLDRAAIALKAGAVLGLKRSDLVWFEDLPKLGCASAVGGVVAWVAREPILGAGPLAVLLASGLAFGVSYLAAALAFGVVRPEERRAARQHVERLQALWTSRSAESV